MKLLLILISFLFLHESSNSQEDTCSQPEQVIEYFRANKEFRKYYSTLIPRFKITSTMRHKGIGDFTYDYLAIELGVAKNMIPYNDTLIINPILTRLNREEEEAKTKENYKLPCLKKTGLKWPANIYVTFSRKDKKVLIVNTTKIRLLPGDTYGREYMFIFDEKDEIIEVVSQYWIQ